MIFEVYLILIAIIKQEEENKQCTFGGERQENKITGVMNYPSKYKEERRYVFYKIHIQKGTISGSNIVDYVHYNHLFRIPYEEVEKKSLMVGDNLSQYATNFRTKDCN